MSEPDSPEFQCPKTQLIINPKSCGTGRAIFWICNDYSGLFQVNSSDALVGKSVYEAATGRFTVPRRTVSVFVEPRCWCLLGFNARICSTSCRSDRRSFCFRVEVNNNWRIREERRCCLPDYTAEGTNPRIRSLAYVYVCIVPKLPSHGFVFWSILILYIKRKTCISCYKYCITCIYY